MSRDEFWATFRRTLGLPTAEEDLETRWVNGYRLDEGTRDVEAGQVVFVDDKEWALAPAAELGMTTVLFRDSDQVRQELTRLGVTEGSRPGGRQRCRGGDGQAGAVKM